MEDHPTREMLEIGQLGRLSSEVEWSKQDKKYLECYDLVIFMLFIVNYAIIGVKLKAE